MSKENLYLDYDGLKAYHSQIKPYLAKKVVINGESLDAAGIKFVNGENSTVTMENGAIKVNVTAPVLPEDLVVQDDIKDFITSEDIPEVPEIDRIPEADINALFKFYSVNTVEALTAALVSGGEITLKEDVALDETKTQKTDRAYTSEDVELNLEDKIVTIPAAYDSDSSGNWSAFYVGNGSTMVVNSGENGGVVLEEGADTVEGPFCFTVGSADKTQSGKLIINSGTFKAGADCVYVMCGEAEIYGGHFEVTPEKNAVTKGYGGPYDFVLNCYDKNYATGDAKITVYGGEFVNFNPEQSAEKIDGVRQSLVAEGYHVVESDIDGVNKLYTVVKD